MRRGQSICGWWLLGLTTATAIVPASATPPIISGDVPTVAKGRHELLVGHLLKRNEGRHEHELPGVELIYGLTARQELNVKVLSIYRDASSGSALGIGDVAIGTKVRLLGLSNADSGLSLSVEASLPTGDRDREIGSGASNFEVKARAGWEIGREVIYVNVGRTWLGERGKEDTWFLSGVWDHPAGEKLRLLTEVYHQTPDEPNGTHRLAATVGIKWRVRPQQQFHFSVGRSLRADAKGGPNLRLYTGWRWDF